MITVKFKKLVPEAKLPTKAFSTDVGFDVRSASCEYDVEHDTYIYHTGLACETESPVSNPCVHACYGFPRSSNCNKEAYLTNGVGLIDSDGYRGEIQARFKNRTSLNVMIELETMKRMLGLISRDNFINFDESYNEIYAKVTEEYTERAKNLEFAPYEVGEKCVQFVFTSEELVQFEEVDEINMNTERGNGGHGSTGK